MSLLTYIERFKFIDSLIRRKATGDTNSLAEKLHLSRSATMEIIREMKEAGFPIVFCKKRKTYYYTEEGKIVSCLFEKEMKKEEMEGIIGGKSFFNLFSESDYTRL